MKWRIYYADGTTRDDSKGYPPGAEDMSSHYGIQVVLQARHDNRFHLLHGHDFYIFDMSGYWIPVDLDSMIERLMFHRNNILSVCKGFAIPLPKFQVIYDQAKVDKDNETLD